MRGVFISGTGTGIGKTFVTRALAAGLCSKGERVAALKPVETGYTDPARSDAQALAQACARPELADYAGCFRARLPLSPYAATLEGEPACPTPALLQRGIEAAVAPDDVVLVEGAGGLLVPLDARYTTLDLAQTLGLPLLLVAPNRLGVLSDTLALFDCAERRGLRVLAVVLVAPAPAAEDASARSNRRILLDRLPVPVIPFPHLADDLALLGEVASTSGLVHLVRSIRASV